jgi:hypothetical protein
LVFNLDEVGISEWEDRKDKRVIVSKTIDGRTIHHRVSRNVKYISTVTYISAGEESLTPYLIISQNSKLFRKKLIHHGVRLGFDFVLRQRLKSYVNSTLLLKYINNIYVPYLNKLQKTEEFKAYEAVLLIDNCSSHMSDDILAILTRERVRIVIFAIKRFISSKCLM